MRASASGEGHTHIAARASGKKRSFNAPEPIWMLAQTNIVSLRHIACKRARTHAHKWKNKNVTVGTYGQRSAHSVNLI